MTTSYLIMGVTTRPNYLIRSNWYDELQNIIKRD